MGHGKKTADRGRAIQTNRERIEAYVAEAKSEFKKMRAADAKTDRRVKALGERLDDLEVFKEATLDERRAAELRARQLRNRPLWRKVVDWVKAVVKGGDTDD